MLISHHWKPPPLKTNAFRTDDELFVFWFLERVFNEVLTDGQDFRNTFLQWKILVTSQNFGSVD